MLLQVLLYVVGGLLLMVALALAGASGYLAYIYWKFSHLPSPKRPSFFFGHLMDIFNMQKETGDKEVPLSVVITKWRLDVQTPLFVIFLAGTPWVITTDSDHVKELSMKPQYDKPIEVWSTFKCLFGQRFLGESLISVLDYETWKPKRKVYDPSFRHNYLKGLIPAFNECVDTFLEKLRGDGSACVPLDDHLRAVAQDVISKVAFGSDFKSIHSDKSLGLQKAKGTGVLTFLIAHSFRGAGVSFKTPSPTLYQWLHPYEVEGYRETIRALRKIGRECIQKRIIAINREEEVPNDILSQILKVAATKLTDDLEELVDDFVTFYVGGQETTSNMLGAVTAHVHSNPNILERLLDEVDEVLGDKDTVSAEDIEKLQYTEQCVLEGLRMYPPITGSHKTSKTDITLSGGYNIPARSVILLANDNMCRMEEYFDEPDEFNPSRFDPGGKQPSPFVCFPFGAGHRICIGKNFAIIEAKIILARLHQQFKITLPPDYKIVTHQRTFLTLRDLPCTLEPRKK